MYLSDISTYFAIFVELPFMEMTRRVPAGISGVEYSLPNLERLEYGGYPRVSIV